MVKVINLLKKYTNLKEITKKVYLLLNGMLSTGFLNILLGT